MKPLLLASLLIGYIPMSGQKVVDVNAASTNGVAVSNYFSVGGTPFANTKFVNLVDGSPYLTDYWVKGVIIGTNGQQYSGRLLKMDFLNNELHFLNKNGQEMLATVDIKEMVLEDTIKATTYRFISAKELIIGDNKVKWCQQLEKGKARLLKIYVKSLSERLPYGASTHEQRIFTNERFYLETDKKLSPVKNEKDVVELLADKKNELEEFLAKSEEKKLSTGDRLTKLVQYYNSLFL